MNWLIRVTRVAAPCALCFACGVPVDDSKYQVVEDPPAPADRIVSAFVQGNDSCEACLRSSCMNAINACVETPQCAEFAACVQQGSSPAAMAPCASRVADVTIETVAAQDDVHVCWGACEPDCVVGKNWSCLGDYSVSRPPRSVATVQQSFMYLCDEGFVQGAEVRYCETDESCGDPVVTDDLGRYTMPIPITQQAPVAGWSGFRRVSGGQLILPHRLQRNIPIWTDQVESTLLMSETCAYNYISDLIERGAVDDLTTVVAVQFFDCQSAGADGVVLEVSNAPEARVLYVESEGIDLRYNEVSSKAAGEGLALVLNVPEGEHVFEARESTSQRLIAREELEVKLDELIIYSMFPKPVK